MITEYAQLLSSTYYFTNQEILAPYKLSHKNHPSAKWVRQSSENWNWLISLGISLYGEYNYRYGRHKLHLAGQKMIEMALNPPTLPYKPFYYPPQCMPDEYKRITTVEAYRAYYIGDKRHLFKWKGRSIPYWID